MKNIIERGGPGSGFRGHRGRQGTTGGSLPRAAGTHLGGLGVPDFSESGKRDFVSQQNIIVDDQMVVALVAMRKMEVFKLKPYRMEVRWYVRDRRGPATEAQATAGQALLDELVTNTEVMLVVQGWKKQEDSRGYWIAPWVQEVELITREDPEVQELRDLVDATPDAPTESTESDTGGWTPPEEGIQWFYDNDPSIHFYDPHRNKDIVESEREKIAARRWAADVAYIESQRPQTVVQRIGGAFRRLIGRHYGPGPHPGTGTEQTVHGGNGAPAVEVGAAERPEHVGASIKISRLLNPVSTVHINDPDIDIWQGIESTSGDWGYHKETGALVESGSSSLASNVASDAIDDLTQGGGGYYEDVEGPIDQNMIDRFVEELIDSDIENDQYEVEQALERAQDEVESETLGPNATWEDMRKYLDISEEKMHGMGSDEVNAAIKLKQGHDLLDKVMSGDYRNSEDWVTNNIIGSADEAEMRDIIEQAIADERDPQTALQWRANDVIDERLRENPYEYNADYIRENFFDDEEFQERFGGTREEWVPEPGGDFSPGGNTYYYSTDNESGEVVAVMETSISSYGLSDDRLRAVADKFGIDPDEVSDQFVAINLLASKYPRNGYGTEMIMAGLKEAYDNDAGLTGSAVMAASMFYAKLGGQYLTEMGVDEGGTAFWTNVQVKAAYEWLESEKARVKAGEITIGQLETAEGLARLEEQEEGTVSGEAHQRQGTEPTVTREPQVGAEGGGNLYSGMSSTSVARETGQEEGQGVHATLANRLNGTIWGTDIAGEEDQNYSIRVDSQNDMWVLYNARNTTDDSNIYFESNMNPDGTAELAEQMARLGLIPEQAGLPDAYSLADEIETGTLSADPTRPLADSQGATIFGITAAPEDEPRLSAIGRRVREASPVQFAGETQPISMSLQHIIADDSDYRAYEQTEEGGRPMIAVKVLNPEGGEGYEIIGSQGTPYEGVLTYVALTNLFSENNWTQVAQGTVADSSIMPNMLEGMASTPEGGRSFYEVLSHESGTPSAPGVRERDNVMTEAQAEQHSEARRRVAAVFAEPVVNTSRLPTLGENPSYLPFTNENNTPAIVVEMEPGIGERERWQVIGYTDTPDDSNEIVAVAGPRFDSMTHAINQLRRQGFTQTGVAEGSHQTSGLVDSSHFPEWFGDVMQIPDDTARAAVQEWLSGQERATGGPADDEIITLHPVEPIENLYEASYYSPDYGEELLQRLVDLIEAEPAVIFVDKPYRRSLDRMKKRAEAIDAERGLRTRHHGPGVHPGTGTSQDVHGSGGGPGEAGGARGAVATGVMTSPFGGSPPRSTLDLVTGEKREVKKSTRRKWSREILANETLAYLQTTNPMDVEDTNFFIDLDGNYYAGDYFHAHIAEIAIRGDIENGVASEGGFASDNPTDILVDGVGFIRGWHRSDKNALGIHIGADTTREQERAIRDLVEFLEVQNSHWDYETEEQFRSGKDLESLMAIISVERTIVERHYGPGAHPGTGTSQDVHGGGGGARGDIALPESLRPRPRVLGRAITLDKIAKLIANPIDIELSPSDPDVRDQLMNSHDWANPTAATFVRSVASILYKLHEPHYGGLTPEEALAVRNEWEARSNLAMDKIVDRAVEHGDTLFMNTDDSSRAELLGMDPESEEAHGFSLLPESSKNAWMEYVAYRDTMIDLYPDKESAIREVWDFDLNDRIAYAGFEVTATRVRNLSHRLATASYERIDPRPEFTSGYIPTEATSPVFVAKIGDEVVGAASASLTDNGQTLYIESIGMKYPGEGHGTQLMFGMLEYADDADLGIEGDAISTARTFYQRLGAHMARAGGLAEMSPGEVAAARTWILEAFSYVESLDLSEVEVVTPGTQGEMDFPAEVPKPSPEQMAPIIEESVDRHYGPGDHPSGSPQSVHGGNGTSGALRRPSKTRVGMTSARPGKPHALVFEEMGDFLEKLLAIESVTNAVVRPGLAGSAEWGREPTWVVSYNGNGLARDLIARTAMAKKQDSVILITEGDTEPVSEFTFNDQVTPAERDTVEELMDSVGFSGWTWFKVPGQGGGTVQAANISQWGGDPQVHKDATRQLRQMFEAIDMPHTLEEYMANVEIMEGEGDNAYQKYFVPTTATS